MWLRSGFLALLVVAAAVPALAQVPPRLDAATPNPILIESGPRVNVITLYGNGFIIGGHPDYYQYDHLQYRKVDPGGAAHDWVRCARPNCQYASGADTSFTLDLIDHDTFSSPGFLEWRFWTGLGVAEANDPSEGVSMVSEWSNILRIPILAAHPTPTPAPTPVKVQRAISVLDNPNLSPRDRNSNTVPITKTTTISTTLSGAMSSVLATSKQHAVCTGPLYTGANGATVLVNGQPFTVHTGTEVTIGNETVQSPNGALRHVSIQIPGAATVEGYFPAQCLR